MTTMDIHEILKCLPHRYPFILIDRVTDLVKGESITAIKNVTINEPFFTGHFPGRPVMPGVMIVEALAQAGAILASKTNEPTPGKESLYLFAGIDKARFKRVVEPGDQLILEVKIVKRKADIWKLTGTATVNGELACSAELLSARKEV